MATERYAKKTATMKIYYSPNTSRISERAFFDTVRNQHPDAEIVWENYRIDQEYLSHMVDTPNLISNLRADSFLPRKRREKCIEVLTDCPPKLKVALDVSRVSFDIVVETNEAVYFWEFHEEQHKKLKVSRNEAIYSADGEPITVPRYLQRLVRDVWRSEHIRPYTIVWSDWFSMNKGTYQPSLAAGYREFGNETEFLFSRFLNIRG